MLTDLASRYRWLILFCLFYTFVAYAFVFQEVPPLIDSIMTEFGIQHAAEAGLLMAIIVLPGVVLALPLGLIVDRYGIKGAGLVSTVLTALGSLIGATANSFAVLLLGRLVLGIGAAYIVTALPAVIPQWFSREEMGKAMGFYGTNMPIATAVAFPVATILLLSYSTWRVPLYVGTALAASAIAVFTVFVKEGPLRQTDRKKITMRRTLASTELWRAGLVWLFFQVTTISFLTWAPTLFQTHKGLDPVSASILAITLMLTTIPLVPLFGWLSDKSGKRKPYLVAGPVIMALAMVASAYTNGLALVASVVFLGVGASAVPAIVSALPPEILKPDEVGVGFGVMAFCLNLGAAIAAPLLGYFYDVTGSMVLSFEGIAVFSLVGAVVAYTLKSK